MTYNALLYGGFMSDGAAVDSMDELEAFVAGVGILALAMTGCAVPFIVSLTRRRLLTFRNVILIGVLLGNVPFAMIILAIVASHSVTETPAGTIAQFWSGHWGLLQNLTIGTTSGTGAALAFWAAIVFRLPTAGRDEFHQ